MRAPPPEHRSSATRPQRPPSPVGLSLPNLVYCLQFLDLQYEYIETRSKGIEGSEVLTRRRTNIHGPSSIIVKHNLNLILVYDSEIIQVRDILSVSTWKTW